MEGYKDQTVGPGWGKRGEGKGFGGNWERDTGAGQQGVRERGRRFVGSKYAILTLCIWVLFMAFEKCK